MSVKDIFFYLECRKFVKKTWTINLQHSNFVFYLEQCNALINKNVYGFRVSAALYINIIWCSLICRRIVHHKEIVILYCSWLWSMHFMMHTYILYLMPFRVHKALYYDYEPAIRILLADFILAIQKTIVELITIKYYRYWNEELFTAFILLANKYQKKIFYITILYI